MCDNSRIQNTETVLLRLPGFTLVLAEFSFSLSPLRHLFIAHEGTVFLLSMMSQALESRQAARAQHTVPSAYRMQTSATIRRVSYGFAPLPCILSHRQINYHTRGLSATNESTRVLNTSWFSLRWYVVIPNHFYMNGMALFLTFAVSPMCLRQSSAVWPSMTFLSSCHQIRTLSGQNAA